LDIITILIVALGLAMDAFAVSIAHGVATKVRTEDALKIAVSFGAFQAFMPLLGWATGVGFRDFISGVDHWIAFGLLVIIGGKMIHESSKMRSDKEEPKRLGIPALLILSIATSIDALAVGLSFSFLRISIVTPIIIIGAVTFLLSFAGVYFSGKFRHRLEGNIEVAGGLVLVAIGIRIVAEHLI
jgi:putative Mn2+ efflux pump MntP